MIKINSSDIIKKPSYVTRPTDITFVEDAKKHYQRVQMMSFLKLNQL
jgi:hypothetical protein